jgi:hypothetical protein
MKHDPERGFRIDRPWRGEQAMSAVRLALLAMVAATMFARVVAAAESSSLGVMITSDREPNKFQDPRNMKYELNGSHTFDSGLILSGLFVYTDDAFRTRTSQNLEGSLGYRVPLGHAFSLTGSAGVGEHWRQHTTAEFPYYVFRLAADLDLGETVTLNAVSLRYRDAFDPNDHFNTPQIATGFTVKLNAQSAIYTRVMRDFNDWHPTNTGVALGFRQRF